MGKVEILLTRDREAGYGLGSFSHISINFLCDGYWKQQKTKQQQQQKQQNNLTSDKQHTKHVNPMLEMLTPPPGISKKLYGDAQSRL